MVNAQSPLPCTIGKQVTRGESFRMSFTDYQGSQEGRACVDAVSRRVVLTHGHADASGCSTSADRHADVLAVGQPFALSPYGARVSDAYQATADSS